jgi:hypothetical protein
MKNNVEFGDLVSLRNEGLEQTGFKMLVLDSTDNKVEVAYLDSCLRPQLEWVEKSQLTFREARNKLPIA